MIGLTALLKAPLLWATFAVATPAVPYAPTPTVQTNSVVLGVSAAPTESTAPKARFACNLCNNTCDFADHRYERLPAEYERFHKRMRVRSLWQLLRH